MGQAYLWAPWIVVAAIVGVLLHRHRGAISAVAIVREAAFVVLAYAAYYVVRGLTAGGATTAIDHAQTIIDAEKWLRIYWEPDLQGYVLDYRWMTLLFNWIYIWWHWPIIIVVALWLFLEKPVAYRRYRYAFLISGAVALVFFAVLPVAPPRLATSDIVDTISLRSAAYRSYEAPAFVNQYAAFPSLHFAWNLLASIAVFAEARNPLLRAGAVVSPCFVILAVIVTGNHFIIDLIAGIVLAVASLIAADAYMRATARRPSRAYYGHAREEASGERRGSPTLGARRNRR